MTRALRVHLPVLGRERDVELPMPGGITSALAALPAARKLSAAAMGASLELRAREGKKPSCKAGCSHCCRQLVPVSVVEAKALALAVAKMPPKRREATRRRFAALLARLESEGIVQPSGGAPRTALVSREKGDASEMWAEVNRHYFSLHLDCPFLEQDRCTVYEERPFVCREYMVTSPATLCASMDPSLEAVPRPIYMTQAVARMAESLDGVQPSSVPLPLLLEWAEAHGGELVSEHPAEAVLEAFVEALEWEDEPPAG